MMTKGKRIYVLDTNVLMHDPTALFKFEEHDVFLPMQVIEELDNAKKGTSEASRNARQVSRFLNELIEAEGTDKIAAALERHGFAVAKSLKEKAEGPKRRNCAFIVDAKDADVVAWEPIWLNGAVVGFCTSGGFSHFTGKSLAQGFLPADQVRDGLECEIEILGERRRAVVHLAPLFDADGARMRG